MFNNNFKDEAVNSLKKALTYNENNSLFNYQIAGFYLKLGNLNDALQYLESGLMINFDKHKFLIDYFPKAKAIKEIDKLNNKYKKK